MSGYSKYRKLENADIVYLELTAKGLGKIAMDKNVGYDIQCALVELEELREDVAALPAGSTVAELVEAVQGAELDMDFAESRVAELEEEVETLRAELAALKQAAAA